MKKKLLAAAIAVAAMYIGGVVCLFAGDIGAGASLWVLSTVIGLAFLWHMDRRKKRDTAASDGSGADDGDPPDPPGTTQNNDTRG